MCGNGKCEDFETCSNCRQDCGDCTVIGCREAFACSLGCLDPNRDPPFSFVCSAGCVSRLCSRAASLYDPAFGCAVQAARTCMGSRGCIQQQCATEIGACLRATCP